MDFIGAGRQDAEYAELVNSFDWANLYRRLDGEALFRALRQRLKAEYDYVLIDSRTGVSDTSGICTVALPDSIVALFTLNRQSVAGVVAVLESLVPQRAERDFAIFPVVTRVELAEKDRLEAARKRTRAVFQKYIERLVNAEPSREYWEDAEILYQPYYAYEEVLAPFGDSTGSNRSTTSLLAAMERLTGRITGMEQIKMPFVPEKVRRDTLVRFAVTERKALAQPQSSQDEAEERLLRAKRYLESNWGSPAECLAARAGSARKASLMITIAIVLSSVLIALMVFFYPGIVGANSMTQIYLMILSPLAAASKVMELARWRLALPALPSASTEDRHPEVRWRVFWQQPKPEFVTLFLLLCTAVLLVIGIGQYKAATPLASTSTLGGVHGIAVALSMLGLLAQTIACLKHYDETARRLAEASAQLGMHVRMYSNQVEPYQAEDDPAQAWKHFIQEVEIIMISHSEYREGAAAVRQSGPTPGDSAIGLGESNGRSVEQSKLDRQRTWRLTLAVAITSPVLVIGLLLVAVLVTGSIASQKSGVIEIASVPADAQVFSGTNYLGLTPYRAVNVRPVLGANEERSA